MTFQLHEDMVLVQKAHRLVLDVYQITQTYPNGELFGLVSQMRRAAVSVPANICEGKGRRSDGEFYRFLLISRASLTELAYFLMLSKDLRYISTERYDVLARQSDEVGRILAGVVAYLRKRLAPKLTSKASRLKPKA